MSIQEFICHIGLDASSRDSEQSDKRFILAHILRSEGMHLKQIGSIFGRHYSSVIWELHRYDILYEIDNNFREKADRIKSLWEKSK